MRPLVFAFLLALGAVPVLSAQPSAAPPLPAEPPARYDSDLLSPAFHRDRRAAVVDALPGEAVAVFFNNPVRNRENDVDFEYRASSDFVYLTGMHEPGSALVLAPGGIEVDGERVEELLFVPPRDVERETWDGRRIGAERAAEVLGIAAARPYARFEDVLGPVLTDPDRRLFLLPPDADVDPGSVLGAQLAVVDRLARPLVLTGDENTQLVLGSLLEVDDPAVFRRLRAYVRNMPGLADSQTDPRVVEAVEQFVRTDNLADWQAWREAHLPDSNLTMLRGLLTALRSVKTEPELVLLQRAIDITAAALTEAMRSIEPGQYEYEVEAVIEYVFKRNGAQYPGFPSIVGSGENTVILHYVNNRRQMEAGDLVLMDVGAEYHHYTADITRTVPVDGRYSDEQRAVYELVLRAADAAIETARAGVSFNAPDQIAAQIISEGLAELGVAADLSPTEIRRRFFMHSTSHYLGLDVHDVGDYDTLRAGNVITVEPGIYISPASDIDPKWWHIGVRIEDDVLVTDGDPVVLSAEAPRTVEEIEAVMAETGVGNTSVAMP